jgi:hypothetical protein
MHSVFLVKSGVTEKGGRGEEIEKGRERRGDREREGENNLMLTNFSHPLNISQNKSAPAKRTD